MMGEVVDDGDSVCLGLHFETAFHALEGAQRFSDLLHWEVVIGCHRRCSGGIQHVVLAGQ